MSLNHIVLQGRITKDIELRRTGTGVAVASFTLAVDRDRKNEAGEKETDFIDCVAWRQTGEFVSKYFTKGSMAIVSGRLQIRNWTDKDGNKRRTAEVLAGSVYFGDSKKSDQGTATYQAPNTIHETSGDFSESMAYIQELREKKILQNQNDFTMLTDDDAQLPFD